MNNYTDCAIDFTANYCGSDHKRSINCRNECYMLKITDKSKLWGFYNSLENPDCTAALLRIVPRLDMNIIRQTISKNAEISEIRKSFYTTMIKKTIERILTPAYEKTQIR